MVDSRICYSFISVSFLFDNIPGLFWFYYILCSFTACFAGASLGVSCDYEQTSVHWNTCCFWGCSFSQSHQYTKGRYVIWWSWTVFHDSCNACGLLDVCFLIKENCLLFDQFHPKIICRDSLFQYKLFP